MEWIIAVGAILLLIAGIAFILNRKPKQVVPIKDAVSLKDAPIGSKAFLKAAKVVDDKGHVVKDRHGTVENQFIPPVPPPGRPVEPKMSTGTTIYDARSGGPIYNKDRAEENRRRENEKRRREDEEQSRRRRNEDTISTDNTAMNAALFSTMYGNTANARSDDSCKVTSPPPATDSSTKTDTSTTKADTGGYTSGGDGGGDGGGGGGGGDGGC